MKFHCKYSVEVFSLSKPSPLYNLISSLHRSKPLDNLQFSKVTSCHVTLNHPTHKSTDNLPQISNLSFKLSVIPTNQFKASNVNVKALAATRHQSFSIP